MGIPQDNKFDIVQFNQDKQSYNYWFRKQNVNSYDESFSEIIYKAIYKAVRLELTEKQRNYFVKYYFEGFTMGEIGELYDVDKATVSRTIKRGRKRLERVLKYVHPKLMNLFEKDDTPKKHRINTNKKIIFKYKRGAVQ